MVRRLDPAQRERLIDAALAMALAAVSVASVFVGDPAGSERSFAEPNAMLVALVLLGSLPLAVRRTWPLAVHFVMLASVTVIDLLDWYPGIVTACLMFSLYTVAERCSSRVAVIGLSAQLAMIVGLALTASPYYSGIGGLLAATLYLAPWVLGRVVQHSRRERELALQRAVTAERERAVAAARAVMDERLRVARELHDIVAHTLSVVAVQAAAARHLLGEADSPVDAPLRAIEDASRGALDDLRRMLGMLRTGDEPVPAELAPVPGCANLEDLVAVHRASHGPVTLVVDPDLMGQSESVRLTVVRLVQESLTNVRKHAPGAATTIVVRCDGELVTVEVDNAATSGDRRDHDAAGFGMIGLRERVALFGGTLTAAARPDGGFRVVAHLDTGRASR